MEGDLSACLHLNVLHAQSSLTWFFAGNWWTWPNEYYRRKIILGFLASLLNERILLIRTLMGF